MEKEKWSVSKIKATKGCRLAFEKRYIQMQPADTIIPELERAKEIHEQIETAFEKRQVSSSLIQPFMNGIVTTEREYRLELPEISAEFIGYADVVIETDATRLIIDIKTRYNRGINDDDRLQLTTYSIIANLERKVPLNKIAVYSAMNEYEPLFIEDIDIPTVDYIIEEIEKAKKRIPRMQINTAECDYCCYKKSCEYAKTEIDENNITQIAEKYLFLEAQTNRYKELLKKHAELTGEIICIGDKKIGFFERNQTIIETELFINICKNNNIGYASLLKIDTTAAKKLLKQHKVLEQAIKR